jgi:catechol 2,3-dioxygenase-like lactoylglutathione lyase family enzyme
MTRSLVLALVALLSFPTLSGAAAAPSETPTASEPAPVIAATPASGDVRPLELGNFSVSLAVKDLAASRAFYEMLGFKARHGDAAQGWLVLQNGTATIGLFQGMFEKNILTFNPGWDRNAQPLADFTDVREIQKRLIDAGLEPNPKADDATTGPASFMVRDPDGNPILVDQFVPRPAK